MVGPFICLTFLTENISSNAFKFTDVRLVNGNHPWEGRVEIRRNGAWGTICDDYWDGRQGKVLCKTLGYAGGTPFGGAQFGQGSGTILRNAGCNGDETNLFSCSFGSDGGCSHSEDAGVICRTQGE